MWWFVCEWPGSRGVPTLLTSVVYTKRLVVTFYYAKNTFTKEKGPLV